MKLKSCLIHTELSTMGQTTNYADYLLKTAKQVHKAATNKYTLFRYIFIFFICFTLCLELKLALAGLLPFQSSRNVCFLQVFC